MTTSSDVTNPDLAPGIEFLRSRIPGLPTDFGDRLDEPVRDYLVHSQFQAFIAAVQLAAPDIRREALMNGVTGRDVLYWLKAAATEVARRSEVASRPPRGGYRSPNVTLRPIVDGDVQPLYLSSLDPRNNHRWRHRGLTPSPEEFRQALFTDQVLAQFMVIPVGQPGNPIGLVSSYDADAISGHCCIAAQRIDLSGTAAEAVAVDDPSRGLIAEGLLIFIQYLFDHFNFRKIYLELPEYNRSLIDGGAESLLVLEGQKTEHYYYGDKWWDQYTYALFHSKWEEFAVLFRGEWQDGR